MQLGQGSERRRGTLAGMAKDRGGWRSSSPEPITTSVSTPSITAYQGCRLIGAKRPLWIFSSQNASMPCSSSRA